MNPTLGIRREDKNKWERRTPITPGDLRDILADGGLRAVVQPAPIRIFEDEEYRAVGAEVREDLSDCDVLFAVKEIPLEQLLPGRAHVFFSHTIKAQAYNMALLQRICDLGATLIDYERIAEDSGRRLVFFSRQAGQAGMLDSLHLLGQRLAHEGLQTPFAGVEMAHGYADLAAAKSALTAIGEAWRQANRPAGLSPLVIGFAGDGNVSVGAQEVADCLGLAEVSPEDLLAGRFPDEAAAVKVVFREPDMVVPMAPDGRFDLQDYYDHPEGYRGCFARFLPALHLLVNGIYWEERYPRLVTRADLAALFGPDQSPKLRVIGDISCDIEGSVEVTLKATKPDRPAYVYDSVADEIHFGVVGAGPVIMAVDNLPAELARESSVHFSASLRPFVRAVTTAPQDVSFADYALPPEIKRAVIVYRGELTADYRYLEDALRAASCSDSEGQDDE